MNFTGTNATHFFSRVDGRSASGGRRGFCPHLPLVHTHEQRATVGIHQGRATSNMHPEHPVPTTPAQEPPQGRLQTTNSGHVPSQNLQNWAWGHVGGVRARLRGALGALVVSGRVTYHHEARKPPLPPPQEGVEGLCGGPHTQENVVAVVTPGKGRVVVGGEGVVRDGVSRLPVALMGGWTDFRPLVRGNNPG